MNATTAFVPRTPGTALRQWMPAALSAAGALGLSLYLALRNYQVDIDVYRMGSQHVLSPDLYSVEFGNSHLLFTYPPFAALVFALCGLHLGLWALQVMWGITNIVALGALIYLSIRIVVPALEHKEALRQALLLPLPVLALNPVFTAVGLGQIDLVLCLLVLWDLATERRIGSRTMPLGVATGLAAAIKLTPLIFVLTSSSPVGPVAPSTLLSPSSHVRRSPLLSPQAPHGAIGPSTSWTPREPARCSTRVIRTSRAPCRGCTMDPSRLLSSCHSSRRSESEGWRSQRGHIGGPRPCSGFLCAQRPGSSSHPSPGSTTWCGSCR